MAGSKEASTLELNDLEESQAAQQIARLKTIGTFHPDTTIGNYMLLATINRQAFDGLMLEGFLKKRNNVRISVYPLKFGS